MVFSRVRKTCKLTAVALSLLLVFVSVCAAAQQTLSTTYYRLYYDQQYSNVAYNLAKYLNAAYTAAAQVLGSSGLPSNFFQNNKINVYTYSDTESGTLGYMYPGETNLYLNIYNGTGDLSKATLGGYGTVVAHETSHILFYQILGPKAYGQMSKYENFNLTYLTESLAFYTGDSVYQYGSYLNGEWAPKYGYSDIKAHLKAAYSRNKNKFETFYGSGLNYVYGQTAVTWWQLHGIGEYLGSTGQVPKLMDNLSYYLNNPRNRTTYSYNGTTVDLKSQFTEYAYYKTFGVIADQSGVAWKAFNAAPDTIFKRYLEYYGLI
jgi:hypothetical protein